MKRLAPDHIAAVLTVVLLVLAAASVELLLPRMHCASRQGETAAAAASSQPADKCVAPPAMADLGLREP
jgi:hypothetical protein